MKAACSVSIVRPPDCRCRAMEREASQREADRRRRRDRLLNQRREASKLLAELEGRDR